MKASNTWLQHPIISQPLKQIALPTSRAKTPAAHWVVHADGVVWAMASSRTARTVSASAPVGFIDWYPAFSLRQRLVRGGRSCGHGDRIRRRPEPARAGIEEADLAQEGHGGVERVKRAAVGMAEAVAVERLGHAPVDHGLDLGRDARLQLGRVLPSIAQQGHEVVVVVVAVLPLVVRLPSRRVAQALDLQGRLDEARQVGDVAFAEMGDMERERKVLHPPGLPVEDVGRAQ